MEILQKGDNVFKPDYLVIGIFAVVAALALTTVVFPALTYVYGLSPEVECMINNGCYVDNASIYPEGLVYDSAGNYMGRLTTFGCIPRGGYATSGGEKVLSCTELVLVEGEVEGFEPIEE